MNQPSDIEIIGTGNIGDKTRQLLKKTPALREIGFHAPRRVVLAEGFFDDFFQGNGLGRSLRDVRGDDLEKRIRQGRVTTEQFETLRNVCASYGTAPLAVRSSAAGDARGTGIYKTAFAENHPSDVRRKLTDVLASYFSAGAVAFRRDAHTGEGFAVMIEPLIGLMLEDCFAPVLSGFGYTSTSRGEGYINVVPGLGGGVETRDGERITRSAMKKVNGDLGDYCHKEIESMFSSVRKKAPRNSALLHINNNRYDPHGYNGVAYFPRDQSNPAHVHRTTIMYQEDTERLIDSTNLLPFFDMVSQMETRFGKSQYFEWAMTIEDGKPKYWITQIADAATTTDILDFGDLGEVLFTAHTVTNTGVRECSEIVYVGHLDHVETLNAFNQQHSNYLLLFPGRLNVGSIDGRGGLLEYSYYNNCSAILEEPYGHHGADPITHWDGRVRETGKLFGVLDTEGEYPPNWEKFDSKCRDDDPIPIYHGRVKVIASERQNRMIVSALD